jgi:hypothetical protein
MPRFAIARFPTPVLTTSAFPSCFGGDSLPLDGQKLLRPIEMVLLPGSKIEMKENIDRSLIWRIATKEHPFAEKLYIDERFVAFVGDRFPERKRERPSVDAMMQSLAELIGSRYIWGGNWPKGIPQLLEWYKPSIDTASLDALVRDTWQLKGVDCSGLLYYASNGCTPRNTEQLIDFGKPIGIAGKSCKAIAALLRPLDLIIWKGHVVIVLQLGTCIESKGGEGVVATSLEKRLEEILLERRPLNKYSASEPCFVARKWI